jgi:glycogen debranching enzyme
MHRIALRARANQYFVYSGQSLLVTNLDGCVAGADAEGFYVENTRLLNRDEPTVGGLPLRTFAASPVGGDGFLAYLQLPAMPGIPARSVYATVRRVVGDGMWTAIRITNYATREAACFDLALHVGADFADLEGFDPGLNASATFARDPDETRRRRDARIGTAWDAARQELTFRLEEPALNRAVAVRVARAPSPARYADSAIICAFALAPRASADVQIAVEPIFDGIRRTMTPRRAGDSATPLGHIRRRLSENAPSLTTTNTTVARAWETAIGDLATLPLDWPSGPAAPIAGLPLYQQFFGRDTLTIGWQAAMAMPEMLRDALLANAAMQGTAFDDWRDEQPGRIIHQARTGPRSLLGLDPFTRYYGDYSAPQDFLIMLGQYFAWTNDRETTRGLLPAARRVLDWLDRYGDSDGDGLLEYETRSAKGIKNQGWKDSDDAIVDERGEIVPNPIATSEIQAYWYVGLQQAALALFVLGARANALRLLRQARGLKRRFHRAFWMEDADFYALALGPDKRQVRSIASNTGHCLAAGIIPRAFGPGVIRRMMRPDLFSGWGIRTLSSDHPAYNPFSYHLGSLWPVENGTIAFGFARYGCWEELWRLAEGIFASTELFVGNRLPEAIGGIARDDDHAHPGVYPESNEPQGWSASMILSTIQALLGMRPVAPLGLLLLDPHLPPWLPDLRLSGLRIGGSVLDLSFWRTRSGRTRYCVRRRGGHVRVLRQPVPDGPESSFAGRSFAALASLPRS